MLDFNYVVFDNNASQNDITMDDLKEIDEEFFNKNVRKYEQIKNYRI